jgi:hypothetical protein
LLLERLPPSFQLLLAVVSIQLGSALAVTLFPVYGALGMLFLRMAAGSLILLVCYRSSALRMLRQAPIGIFLLGLTMAVQSGLYYEALARIPLGITVSIEFLGPLGLALATSRRLVDIACVLMAAAGIALLTPSIGTSLDPLGVFLAFAAGTGWAWYIVLIRRLGRQVEGGPGMALAMIISALLLLPYPGLQALADVAAHPGDDSRDPRRRHPLGGLPAAVRVHRPQIDAGAALRRAGGAGARGRDHRRRRLPPRLPRSQRLACRAADLDRLDRRRFAWSAGSRPFGRTRIVNLSG